MVLCFSNKPLRVKLNAVYEIESIKSTILFSRDLGVRGSSIYPSPASASFSFFSSTASSFLSYYCFAGSAPSAGFSPSAFLAYCPGWPSPYFLA